MSYVEFLSSSVYRDRRSYINSWGPLVSRPLCIWAAGTPRLSAKTCVHQSPTNLLFQTSFFEEDHLGDFHYKYLLEAGIPDLSGTVFNAIVR